jgi:hypothetical protein
MNIPCSDKIIIDATYGILQLWRAHHMGTNQFSMQEFLNLDFIYSIYWY